MPLKHFVTGQVAECQLRHDMMNFRDIGQATYRNHVEYKYLSNRSTKFKHLRKNLKSFTDNRVKKKWHNVAERQRRLVQTCIKKTLVFSFTPGQHTQRGAQQFLNIPRAIADPNGIPCKGVKANTTKVLERRYLGVVQTFIPPSQSPYVVVLDGMFIISSSPLRLASAGKFKDYFSCFYYEDGLFPT